MLIYNRNGCDSKYYFAPYGNEIPEISEKEINDFLKEMGEEKREANAYFIQWSSIEKFDYITFLEFLRTEAGKKNKQNLTRYFDGYISEINRLDRDRRRGSVVKAEARMCLELTTPAE